MLCWSWNRSRGKVCLKQRRGVFVGEIDFELDLLSQFCVNNNSQMDERIFVHPPAALKIRFFSFHFVQIYKLRWSDLLRATWVFISILNSVIQSPRKSAWRKLLKNKAILASHHWNSTGQADHHKLYFNKCTVKVKLFTFRRLQQLCVQGFADLCMLDCACKRADFFSLICVCSTKTKHYEIP